MNGLMGGYGSLEWILKLPELMNENGLEEAKLWRLEPDMTWAKFLTDCHALVFAEIASKLPENDDRKRDLEQVVADVGVETKQGAVQGVAKVICVGRKSVQDQVYRSDAEFIPLNASSSKCSGKCGNTCLLMFPG